MDRWDDQIRVSLVVAPYAGDYDFLHLWLVQHDLQYVYRYYLPGKYPSKYHKEFLAYKELVEVRKVMTSAPEYEVTRRTRRRIEVIDAAKRSFGNWERIGALLGMDFWGARVKFHSDTRVMIEILKQKQLGIGIRKQVSGVAFVDQILMDE